MKESELNALILAALPEVRALVARALAAAGGVAPPDSSLDQLGLGDDGVRTIREYLQHGEAGLALEHLIYMAEASELPLPPSTFRRIDEAGRAMKMDPQTWEFLPRESGDRS